MTCIAIRGIVVSSSFVFPHPPEDKNDTRSASVNVLRCVVSQECLESNAIHNIVHVTDAFLPQPSDLSP